MMHPGAASPPSSPRFLINHTTSREILVLQFPPVLSSGSQRHRHLLTWVLLRSHHQSGVHLDTSICIHLRSDGIQDTRAVMTHQAESLVVARILGFHSSLRMAGRLTSPPNPKHIYLRSHHSCRCWAQYTCSIASYDMSSESGNRYVLAFISLYDCVCCVDRSGHYTYQNPDSKTRNMNQ